MIRNKLSLSLFLCLFAGCGKKYTCSYNNYYVPVSIAFVGYEVAELKEIVIRQYSAGSNFSDLISIDTIDASSAFFQTDTAYSEIGNMHYSGFWGIQSGVDCLITLPGVSRDYTITGIRKGPEVITWTQEEPCSPGAGQARIVPYSATVDGVLYTPFAPVINNYFIYLER